MVENNIIIRNDDVNPITNVKDLESIYAIIRETIPNVEIWSCISLMAKQNSIGALYPDLPLRGRDKAFFYDVNCLGTRRLLGLNLGTIVSHGLLHIDHSHYSRDAQEISIITSCNLLNTKIFVPPFSSFNEDTKQICEANSIRLVKPEDGWKSLESEKFDPKHKLWFFHSWRFNPETFKEKFIG